MKLKNGEYCPVLEKCVTLDVNGTFKGLPPLATVKKSIFFYCIFLKYKYLRKCPENFKSIRTKLTEI